MKRRAMVAALGAACVLLVVVPYAASTLLPHQYSSGNPHTHDDPGIVALAFGTVANFHGKTKRIQAQLFTGFPDPNNPGQAAAVAITLHLYCDPEATGDTNVASWIQLPPNGEGGIRVHHNKFSYQATAFDGRFHEGQITFRGKFTRKAAIATGSVRVSGAQMHNENGSPLKNCDTEPRGTSAARGQPLRWRLHGVF